MSELKPCKICRRKFKVDDVMVPLTTVVAFKHGDGIGNTVGYIHMSCLVTQMPKPTKAELRKGLRKEETDGGK